MSEVCLGEPGVDGLVLGVVAGEEEAKPRPRGACCQYIYDLLHNTRKEVLVYYSYDVYPVGIDTSSPDKYQYIIGGTRL